MMMCGHTYLSNVLWYVPLLQYYANVCIGKDREDDYAVFARPWLSQRQSEWSKNGGE